MAGSLVEEFVRRTSRSYRVRRLAAEGLKAVVAAAIVVACVAVALPSWWPRATWIGVALLGCLGALRWRALRFDVVEADHHLGLRGGLITWVETRSVGAGDAMRRWLERQLADRIEDVPDDRVVLLGRRGLGPARSALLLLLVLLLLRLVVLPPLPDGVLQLAGQTAAMGAAAGGAGGGDGAQPEPNPAPSDQDEPGEAETPPDEPPEPAPQEPADEGPELPPEGLMMDPPIRDDFVVPSFVGAGEGRTTEAPAAGIDEGAGGQQAPGGATAGGGGGGESEPPVDSRVDFERALEAALRSRHVPDHERPFVRRWFRSLLDDGR